jgi:hypothetical protein
MDELKNEHVDMVAEFRAKAAAGKADSYMLTIARDGESPARSIYFYPDAVDAAKGYEAYQDWGFAKDFLTVELYEPSGRVHTKTLRRPKGGECVFHREQYHQITEIMVKVKDSIEPDSWHYLGHELARIFSKDNQRFNEERFLSALGVKGASSDGPVSY